MSSNASTAGSFDESRFLKRTRTVHFVRLGLSVIATAGAIAVIACEAVPLRHHQDTAQWASIGLALWPLNLDVRPTIASLACGCVIAVLNLAYAVVALLPSPHPRIGLLNSYAMTSSFAGFLTALVGVTFTIYRPSASYPSGFSRGETLQSWTCKWKAPGGLGTAPIEFSRDCIATRAGFGLLCTLLGLEILMALAAIAGTLAQRDVSRRREENARIEKLDFAAKQVYQA
ncbi:hypothetical protein PDE_00094 [Penicillium oxalicum 114-2]|uniref:MARVEL domain-containing protein n=1 Tax=Penicillium oxalicum (strain 114-2 / CGMCC 5302) TaxID=933388 RepID=S8AHF3_PENO1|nr:hypothetical protein PDE_00094 [Penicillium oxalicum 114-2]